MAECTFYSTLAHTFQFAPKLTKDYFAAIFRTEQEMGRQTIACSILKMKCGSQTKKISPKGRKITSRQTLRIVWFFFFFFLKVGTEIGAYFKPCVVYKIVYFWGKKKEMETRIVRADHDSYLVSSLLADLRCKNILCSGVWFSCFGKLLAQEWKLFP